MAVRGLFRGGYRNLKKSGGDQFAGQRPIQSSYYKFGMAGRNMPLRRLDIKYTLEEMYAVARLCNAVSRAVQLRTDYIFKEGYEWVPKFSRQCLTCDKKHPPETKPEECSKCGAFTQYAVDPTNGTSQEQVWYREPDEDKTRLVDEFFEKVNKNGHSFIQVMKMFERHMTISNNGFAIANQEYKFDQMGNIASATVKEINIPDPLNFRISADEVTLQRGTKWRVCLRPDCRPKASNYAQMDYLRVSVNSGASGVLGPEVKTCPSCASPTHPVWYVTTDAGGEIPVQYYTEREVLHAQKIPSLEYNGGGGEFDSVMDDAIFLIKQIDLMTRFYTEERSPRDIIVVMTRNEEALRKVIEEAEDNYVSTGSSYHPVIAIEPVEGVSDPIKHIELTPLPKELETRENRRDAINRVGSTFGVSGMFLGDNEAQGLQQQGPSQRVVTTLATEISQNIYNNDVFPKLLKLLGCDEWQLKLRPPEEKNDVEALQAESMEWNIAQQKQGMGLKFLGVDLEGRPEFSSEPDPNAGGMGAPPGGGGPPGMGDPNGGGGWEGQGAEPPPPPTTRPPGGDIGVNGSGESHPGEGGF